MILVDCCIALQYSSDGVVLLRDILNGNVEATFQKVHPATAATFTFAAAQKFDIDIGLFLGCEIRRYVIIFLYTKYECYAILKLSTRSDKNM